MRFSFVIATFNKRDYLKHTLEALDHQEGYGRKDYEVIVVDDGSDQDVFSYIKKVNSNYYLNYIYLERMPRSCVSRSRNYGIKVARGKYVVLIDDDMMLGKNYLSELDRYYKEDPELLVVGTRIHCPTAEMQPLDPATIKQKAFNPHHSERMLEERHVTFNSLSYNIQAQKYPWMMSSTSNLTVPRKQLMRVGGFDEGFTKWGVEDMELGYRLYCNGGRLVVNSKLPAFHQDHPIRPKGENNFNRFVKKCKDAFKTIDPIQLMTVFGQNSDDPETLKPFRLYQGDITRREKIEFDDAGKLEEVKQKILELSRLEGTEIKIIDRVENSDLDIWCQLQDPGQSILSYLPHSCRISAQMGAEVMHYLLSIRIGGIENKES